MTEPNAAPERRIHPRYAVTCMGELHAPGPYDWFVLDCRFQDISISGVHVLVDRSLAAGDRLVLRIANVGQFPGTVVWAQEDRLGIRFDQEARRLAELARVEGLSSLKR